MATAVNLGELLSHFLSLGCIRPFESGEALLSQTKLKSEIFF